MKIKVLLLLVIAMLSVSTSPIIARYLENVSAVSISFWRMGIGSLLLWIFSSYKTQIPLGKNNYSRTVLSGVFLGIHFALFFGSIKLTTIANATFLGTLAPVVTFIIEKYFLKRKYNANLLLGLGLALFGAFIIVSNKFDFSSSYTIGNLLAICCSIFLGFSFIISDNVRKQVGTISYTRSLFGIATFTLFIIAMVLKIDLIKFSSYEFIGLLYLGIVPTLLGHGLMYYSIRYVSPTIVASIPMGEPIIASIIAYFLFNELIGFITFLGGAITLIGLTILVRKNI